MHRPGIGWSLIAGGALAIVGGLFLPWATVAAPFVGSLSVTGAEGDGWIVAGGGVLAIVAGALAILGIAAIAWVAVADFPGIYESVVDITDDTIGLGQLGSGIYAVVVSLFVLLVALLTTWGASGKPPPSPQTRDTADHGAPSNTPPIEERLAHLDRLRDLGLIDQEEYSQKRRQLLDEL